MAVEQTFSLGDLDDSSGFEQEETYEQEELHPEDVSTLEEESDNEELDETEELDEEESESEEVDGELLEEDEDDISYTPFLEPFIEDGILIPNPDKEYDDSPEGYREVLEDTLDYRDAQRIAALPEVLQQVFELAKLGEDPMEAFNQLNSFDYSAIDMESEENHEILVRDLYEDKFPNWTKEKLDRTIQNLKDLGELEGEATEAQQFFIEKTAEEKEAYIEQVRQANELALARQEEEVAEYKRLIQESEGFKGLKFTSNQDKAQFEQYAFARGKDGLTQYERDTQKAEDKLTQAFYSYKKFGFDTVAKAERTKAVVEQKKILKRVKDKNAGSNRLGQREVERPQKGFFLGDV